MSSRNRLFFRHEAHKRLLSSPYARAALRWLFRESNNQAELIIVPNGCLIWAIRAEGSFGARQRLFWLKAAEWLTAQTIAGWLLTEFSL